MRNGNENDAAKVAYVGYKNVRRVAAVLSAHFSVLMRRSKSADYLQRKSPLYLHHHQGSG